MTFAAVAVLVATSVSATAIYTDLSTTVTQLVNTHAPDDGAADADLDAADTYLGNFADSFVRALNTMHTRIADGEPGDQFGVVALRQETATLHDTDPVVANYLAAEPAITAMTEAEQVARILQRPIDEVGSQQTPTSARDLFALRVGPSTGNSRPFAVIVGTPHRYPIRPAGTEWVDLTVYVGEVTPDGSTLLAYDRLNDAESTQQIEAMQRWRVAYSAPEGHS